MANILTFKYLNDRNQLIFLKSYEMFYTKKQEEVW